MGTGNLPAAGSSYVPVELMEDVQYAKCSDYGMIILKEDGSVWCAGTLYDEAGNVIREYSGFEQVMDHAVFATASSCRGNLRLRERIKGDLPMQNSAIFIHAALTPIRIWN